MLRHALSMPQQDFKSAQTCSESSGIVSLMDAHLKKWKNEGIGKT